MPCYVSQWTWPSFFKNGSSEGVKTIQLGKTYPVHYLLCAWTAFFFTENICSQGVVFQHSRYWEPQSICYIYICVTYIYFFVVVILYIYATGAKWMHTHSFGVLAGISHPLDRREQGKVTEAAGKFIPRILQVDVLVESKHVHKLPWMSFKRSSSLLPQLLSHSCPVWLLCGPQDSWKWICKGKGGTVTPCATTFRMEHCSF